MLEELASCAIIRSGNNILLWLAALSLVIGFLITATSRSNDAEPLVIGFVIALVLVLAYFASQQQVLTLASAGTTITTNTKGIELEAVKKFIDHVEAAKNERYLIGRKSNDSDPLPSQQQARWSEWADSLPRKTQNTSEVVPQGHETKVEVNVTEEESTVSLAKADSGGERGISHLLERYEAAEDRLGVRLEGLFARIDQENRCIHLSGELHAREEGGELGRDLEIIATIHDSSGRVMHKQSITCRSESFFGFDAFSLSMETGRDVPTKIRVYPREL